MRGFRSAGPLIAAAAAVLLLAAAPPDAPPEELIHRANAAFLRGERDEADDLYSRAEERTADPGLVAFNRAAVLFQKEQYGEAERYYTRAIEDAACPPERAARAWYNRGACLIRRGNGTAAIYRSAIACLERCLDSDAADEPLKADARYNLELAKLLWNDARKKEKKPNNPNEDLPQEDSRNELPPPRSLGTDPQGHDAEQGLDGNTGMPVPKSIVQPAPGAGLKPNPAQAQTPAPAAHLQPLQDESTLQALSAEEAREYLRRTAERLRRDQQNMRKTMYGQERIGTRDW